MLVSKLRTLLNQSLATNQVNQIHAIVVVNGLNHLEPLLLQQVLLSAKSFPKRTSQYIKTILLNMQKPDAFSWSCTIRFFCKKNQYREALSLFVTMRFLGLSISTYSFCSALKACAEIGHKAVGFMIHSQAQKYGLFEDVYVKTAFVDFYSKMGNMKIARDLFDEMGERNVVSWNSLISGYIRSGEIEKARYLFDEMPNKDSISWNTMMSGYWRTRDVEKACSLFDRMPEKTIASWNAMISGYLDSGQIKSARNYFDSMPERNNITWMTMISGYSKCGEVESARNLFDLACENCPNDLLVYNAMISCYAQNGRSKQAVNLFDQMIKSDVNIYPDKMTLASVISACSQLGDLIYGSWVESYMEKNGMIMDDHLATAFIDLYAKCGNIDKAYELFRTLRKKDVVSYTALILGCGINGRADDAIRLFKEMETCKINPNSITFMGILTAYNHFGLVEEGYGCFNLMEKYNLVPSADHYAIVVDLLGRAGRVKDAYELVKRMPVKAHSGVWGSLLSGCNMHNDVEIGEIAAKKCIELESDSSGYCSLLANIYANSGRWDDAKSVRMFIQDKGISKIPGCSWME
ncbi:pentatricopeptide repeat-containing protein At4g22760 [Impatiens glandulifera]|uniref:pentatricopeptide repeat-containing protein At4g22760 n=1 Tax=Impatiens glandulifera TaxID=253017 RepID=UPI001FB0EF84|nr:pentatricopeptide repeat-containing protein At4g22760 [Impatiens glandulifera]